MNVGCKYTLFVVIRFLTTGIHVEHRHIDLQDSVPERILPPQFLSFVSTE
jgi:hypothetical protein